MGLLVFLFVFLLALLLDVKLWLFPLFFTTFIFLSNVTHDDYSFLVGLSLGMTGCTLKCSVIDPILPLVTAITQYFHRSNNAKILPVHEVDPPASSNAY